MPGFASRGRESVRAVAQYLLAGEDSKVVVERSRLAIDLKYTTDGYKTILDPDG